MVRGRFDNTLEYGYLIRDPLTPNRPFFVLKSPADDLNAMALSQILHLRGLEEFKTGTWEKTLFHKEKIKPVLDEIKEQQPQEKKGFLGRLISKFRKDSKTEPSLGTFKKGDFDNAASFIPQTLVIEAVSNLPIVDIFDIYREGNYEVEGIFETDLKTNVSTFLSKPSLSLASKVLTFLEELKPLLSNVFENAFNMKEFFIDEIFYTTQEKHKYLLIMDHSLDIDVGLLARAPPDANIGAHYTERVHEIDHLQRKSLAMRTNQYLKARRHSSSEDAIERIYGQNFAVSTAKKEII